MSHNPKVGAVNPRLTVITPTYNSLPFIIETAKSVLALEVPYEWIVVDDLSTDGTREYMMALAKENSSVVLITSSERAGGPRPNYIRGLRRAQGTYVLFLDHDDMLNHKAIECAMGRLDNSDSGVALTRVAYIDEQSRQYKIKTVPFLKYDAPVNGRLLFWLLFLLPIYPLKQGAVVARRSLFEHTKEIFDIKFVLAATKLTDPLLISEVGLRYRNSRNSVSSRRHIGSEEFWSELAATHLPDARYYGLRHVLSIYRHAIGLCKLVYGRITPNRI